MIYKKYIKRLLDLFISLLALVLLSPLLLFLAILVRIKLGSPVLFEQKRPGLNEEVFVIYKFRTMTNQKDAQGKLLDDEIRLNPFGKYMRKTSLDELPSLINIIKGDMSFIGPRPLLLKYLPYFTAEERIRHTVRPGLTGLAQISGRNFLNWEERFVLDIKYVKHITFINDLKIILKTVFKVVKQSDIMEHANVPELDFKDLDIERGG